MTHKHLRFGFGVCGAKPPFSSVTGNPKHVDCPECRARMAEKAASLKQAREKASG